MTDAETLFPEGVVPVPLKAAGKIVDYAQANKADLDALHEAGITGAWFLSRERDRVLVRMQTGKVVPVSVLIMRPRNDQKVVNRDGDPTNLTRENLELAPRQLIDILWERQKGKPRAQAAAYPQ